MIRLSKHRKTLIAGTAGVCIALPAALCVPQFGPDPARADDQAPVRNPNHVLRAAVERELSGLGIEADSYGSGIQPTAGEMQPGPQSYGGQQPGFNSQHYHSEVQRQLQMLYQRDGRTMPNMVPTPPVPEEAWEQYRQQHGQLPTSGRRPSRWDWLNPSRWRRGWQQVFGRSNQPQPEPPEAPEFNPEGTETPAEIPTQVPSTLTVHPLEGAPRIQAQPQSQEPVPAPAQAASPQPRLFPGLLEEMQAPVAEPVVEAPALILMPAKPDDTLAEPQAAPPVQEPLADFPYESVEPARPERNPDAQVVERLPTLEWTLNHGRREESAAADESDLLNDPFPELAEEAADEQSGPYSGLELELDPFTEPVPAQTGAAERGDENPFAPFVERSAEARVTVQPRLPKVDEVGPSLQGPGLPSEPAALPNIEPRELPTTTQSGGSFRRSARSPEVQEKMDRIAARVGLTGLKGFCPVVLRDHRDLEDASAEFTVIYDGKQYWFSSEQAKQAFLMAPEAYAPVGGGIDLVHYQKTGEELDGSLDHAAWFQGRLHLFSSAENKAEFVASPRTYSLSE